MTSRRALLAALGGSALASGCALPGAQAPERRNPHDADTYVAINRLTWGVTVRDLERACSVGYGRYLQEQLHPPANARCPEAVQRRIDALSIQQVAAADLVSEMEDARKAADLLPVEEARKAAQDAYQKRLSQVSREAATRHLLRALYSEHQLLEHLTWFWFNHFNVHQYKLNLRVLVGDYEESALRPHALGRFSELLRAVARHPAMLRYLDNDQNAIGRLNENYAREFLELHTLGVDGGYVQADVQELARVLTGVGYTTASAAPAVRRELAGYYVRAGNFEFNPNRHDFGTKTLLARPVRARGLDELDEVVERVSAHPATARYVSRRLATFLLSDEPPADLVEQMASRFSSSGGKIAEAVAVLVSSKTFTTPPAEPEQGKFKDPMHFVVSALRLAYEDKVVLNTGPAQAWLNRLGEGLYNRPTPDGYPLTSAAWAGAGQMNARFEVARQIGSGGGLFKPEDPAEPAMPAFPQLQNELYFEDLRPRLGASTRSVLDRAASSSEWNALLLSSPEFMYR
jgi:uncharacterized protein (DUF1800 family)